MLLRPARRRLFAAAGALAFPAAMLMLSGVRPGVASIIAAELVYLWLLVFFTARRRLAGLLGPVTAYAAVAVGAALTLAPLGLTSPLCSAGVGSPWCRREIGTWALVGLLATLLMMTVTFGRQAAAAAGNAARRLTRRARSSNAGAGSAPAGPSRPVQARRRGGNRKRRRRR